MTQNVLTVQNTFNPTALLIPAHAGKDETHRLTLFTGWLTTSGQNWLEPDLAAYRDYLLTAYAGRDGKPLAAASVLAHLSSIRGQYRKLLKRNDLSSVLEAVAYESCVTQGYETSPANISAAVYRAKDRMSNAIDAAHAKVEIITRQDKTDESQGLRLTREQAESLINKPGVDTLQGLRDTAILALMLCTGIREMELCALDVADLRKHLGEALALHVRKGKGAKERLIPYGELDFCLPITDTWLKAASIIEDAVFRGFYKAGKRVRPGRLTVRAINQILDRYPVSMAGQLTYIQPHDLRRTYARRLHDAGTDILAIQQNLGHADHKTTEKYIGKLDASARQPKALYHFDLSRLPKLLA